MQFSFRFSALITLTAIWLSVFSIAAQAQNNLAVVSAASYSDTALAPESIAAAFGEQLATTTATGRDSDPTTPGIQLPTTLGGTTVLVNNVAAPLFFVSPLQINFLLPAATPVGNDVSVEMRTSSTAVKRSTIRLKNFAPGVFTANGTGMGTPAAYLLRVKANNQQFIEPLVVRDAPTGGLIPQPVDLSNETDRVFLILFATGVRYATDPNRDGNVNETVRVLLNGYEATPLFAGRQPDLVGLDQVNCEISRAFLGSPTLTVRLAAPTVTINQLAEAVAAPEQTLPHTTSNPTEVRLAIPPLTQARWQAEGFANQDVNALLSTGEILLAGTTTGIHQSVDDGVNFIPARFFLPQSQNPRTNVLQTLDSVGLIAGHQRGGVWRSHINQVIENGIWIQAEEDFPFIRETVLALAYFDRTTLTSVEGKGVYRFLPSDAPQRAVGLADQKVLSLGLNSERYFAGTLTGLQISTNAGGTWQAAAGGFPANVAVNVLLVEGATIYAGTSRGLWHSTDSGRTWRERPLATTGTLNVQCLLRGGANFLAGTDVGLYASNDNGASWKTLNDGLTNRNLLSLAFHAGRLYAGTRGGGLFATQTVPSLNLPPVANPLAVALDEDRSATFKLTGSDANGDALSYRLLTQPSRGTLSGTAPNLTYTPHGNFFGADSFAFIVHDGKTASRLATVTLTVRPVEDPLTIYISGGNESFVGGLVNFYAEAHDPDLTDQSQIKVTAVSLPSGAVTQNSSYGNALYFKWVPTAAGSFVVRINATENNGESKTTDKTLRIAAAPVPQGAWVQVPLFLDQAVEDLVTSDTAIYLLGEDVFSYRIGKLYRSTDGGRSWTLRNDTLPATTRGKLLLTNNLLYDATEEGLWRSLDQGATFTNVTRAKNLPEDGKNLTFTAEGDRVLAHNDTKVFYSANRGDTWTDVSRDLPAMGSSSFLGGNIAAAVLSGENLVVSLNGGVVQNLGPKTFRTTPQGTNWLNANQGVEGTTSIGRFFTDGPNQLIGLTGWSYFHVSTNNGASWLALNAPPFGTFPPFASPISGVATQYGQIVTFTDSLTSGAEIRRTTFQRVTSLGRPWEVSSLGEVADSIQAIAIGRQSIFAVSWQGGLYRRPNP